MQWTEDDLDSGGGLMTNKNKSLASESDGDVFVGTIPSVGVYTVMVCRCTDHILARNPLLEVEADLS